MLTEHGKRTMQENYARHDLVRQALRQAELAEHIQAMRPGDLAVTTWQRDTPSGPTARAGTVLKIDGDTVEILEVLHYTHDADETDQLEDVVGKGRWKAATFTVGVDEIQAVTPWMSTSLTGRIRAVWICLASRRGTISGADRRLLDWAGYLLHLLDKGRA